MNDYVQAQLDEFEHELAALNAKFEALQREIGSPKLLLGAQESLREEPAAAPDLEPFPLPTPPRIAPWPTPHDLPSRPARPPRKQLELDLLGPRALAIAGGIVTLLGIVFFFVLAVNRGWIGPNARVALGAIASALVFAAGLWLKRRYGTTYSALAAVGAGIAGGYATLLSAAALYDML